MRKLRAFTLIEVLIVVVILGILAAISVASFGGVSISAREGVVRESLLQLRTQISYYTAQHGDVPPDGAQLQTLLTSRTNQDGVVDGAGPQFGPYLSDFPPNPLRGSNRVKVLGAGDPITADSGYAWLYQVLPGGRFVIAAANPGADSHGKTYISY